MGTVPERYEKAGEIAEEQRQFELAAHHFLMSARYYRSSRNILEAEETAEMGRRLLARTILLADSAQDFEIQASNLADHALATAGVSETDPKKAATELYSLTASLYEGAAHRFIALAEQAGTSNGKGYFLARAAEDMKKAGRNLSTAAFRCQSWEIESESRSLLEKASPLKAEASRLTALGMRLPDEDQEVCRELTLIWLTRLARPRCKECNQLWSAYVENSRHCIALMRRREIAAAAGGSAILREFSAAAEWQRLAMQAVLDHEEEHRDKLRPKVALQDGGGNTMALSRVS